MARFPLGIKSVDPLRGGAAAALAAIVVLTRAVGRRRVHMLDVASTAYFVVLGATLVIIRPGHLDFWARYAQAGSHTALMLLVFGSILVGRPFTEAYARDTVPESVWHTDRFHSLNRQISTVWGLAFLVGTVSLIAAGSVDSRQVLLRSLRSLRVPLLRLRVHAEADQGSQGGTCSTRVRQGSPTPLPDLKR